MRMSRLPAQSSSRVGRMVPGSWGWLRSATISASTARRSAGSVTGVARTGRSARIPFLRWTVRSGRARRLACQSVAAPPAPLHR